MARGLPPLKGLPDDQRGSKQRWSEWSTFMGEAASHMEAGRYLVEAVQLLEAERAELQERRFVAEEARWQAAEGRKAKKPKQPALSVAGFVAHKTGKRKWV